MAERYKLNIEDMKKVGKGALIAVVGAGLTYGVEAVSSIDFGGYTPIAVAAFGIFANFVRKLLQDN